MKKVCVILILIGMVGVGWAAYSELRPRNLPLVTNAAGLHAHVGQSVIVDSANMRYTGVSRWLTEPRGAWWRYVLGSSAVGVNSDRWHLYIVDTGDALVALRCVPSDMAGRLDRIPVRVMALEDDPLTRTLLADYGGRPRIANDLLPIALRADFGAEGLSEEDIDVVWGLSVLLILAGSVALLGRWVMKRRRKGE